MEIQPSVWWIKAKDHTVTQKITRIKRIWKKHYYIRLWEWKNLSGDFEVIIRILDDISYYIAEMIMVKLMVFTQKNDERIIIDVSSFII